MVRLTEVREYGQTEIGRNCAYTNVVITYQ